MEAILRVLPPVRRLTAAFPQIIYRWTPFHCDGLLLGAALSLALWTGLLTRAHIPALRVVALAAAVAAAAMLHVHLLFYTTPIAALAAACAIASLALNDGKGAVSRLLSIAPLRLTGRYSYFMYCTQTLAITVAVQHIAPHLHPHGAAAQMFVSYTVPIALCFCAAALSWLLVEGPVNRLKRFIPYTGGASQPGAQTSSHTTETLAA